MSDDTSVILVRHPQVSADWKGICYGATDVPLSSAGLASIPSIAGQLARMQPGIVCHSGLTRSMLLASAIAESCGARIYEDDRLGELNFGIWEGRSWNDIYADVGDSMAGMIHAPQSYAPPGGETVFTVRKRVISAINEMSESSLVIAVSHGGPISMVKGTLSHMAPKNWPDMVPACGEWLALTRADRRQLAALSHKNFER